MRKILCLALPAMLVAACGSDNSATPDARPSDVAIGEPTVCCQLDVAPPPQDAPPDLTIDSPSSPDVPKPIDLLPAVDQAGGTDDGPSVIDSSLVIDARPAIDGPFAVDGPRSPSDAQTVSLYNPDGRIVTVVLIDYCPMGRTTSTVCPSTYAEALAKAASATMDAGLLHTRAGRCSEGAYTYIPFTDNLDGQVCYYSATQQLIGDLYFTDVLTECSIGSGTASFAFGHGEIPPCTNVTWEVNK
jgi:hypothetical protein